MEKSEMISRALKESIDCQTLHQELLLLLKPLGDKPIEDLLDIGRDESLEEVDRKIHTIFDQTRQKAQQNGDTTDFIEFINVARVYLREGVQQADIRSVLISIWLNCYLNIKTIDLLSIPDVVAIEKIYGAITTILSKVPLGISTPSNTPFHEKEMLEKAEDGFANNNIGDVYDFVKALENSSRGPLHKPILLGLMRLLHDLDFDAFIKHLATLNDIYSIVFVLQWYCFSIAELLRIANEPSLTNKWMNFELIRQLTEIDSVQELHDGSVTAICNILSRIKEEDLEFLKQTVRYFHRSRPINIKIFDAALGKFLSSCDKKELLTLTDGSLDINQYDYNRESRDILKDSFEKNSTPESYSIFLQSVFSKWERFWEAISTDNEFYAREFIFTDYANFVIDYYSSVADNEKLIEKIHSVLDLIRYIDVEWTTSKYIQRTKFYIYLSEFLLLSYAYRNKEMSNMDISSSVATVLNNPMIGMRYDVSELAKSYIDQIIQNTR